MKERDLVALESLAHYGTFMSAAERMKVAQPYLSKYVRDMEERYGAPLVNRQTKPLTLTAVGRGLLERLQEINVLERRALAYCRDQASQEEGTIRIASNSDRTNAALATVIGRFAQRHPHVIIDLSQNMPVEQVPAALLQGAADVGMTFESLLTPDLNGYALFKERLLLAIPKSAAPEGCGADYNDAGDYPLLSGSEQFLELLPLLTNYKHEDRREVLSRFVGAPIPLSPVRSYAANYRLAIAAAGAGCTVIQEQLAGSSLARAQCRFYSLENLFPPRTLVIAWSTKAYLSTAAEKFCRAVRDHYTAPATSKTG